MKKTLLPLLALLALVVLGACGQSQSKKSSSSPNQTVSLTIKADKKVKRFKVNFKDGDTVMTVLKAKTKVEEKAGFITAINCWSQDPAAKKYWIYKVNGKLAPKMADQTKVKKGDKIEFYLDVMK